MLKKSVLALIAAVLFSLPLAVPVRAGEAMDENKRRSMFKQAADLAAKGNINDARAIYKTLLESLDEKDPQRALYFYEWGLTFIDETSPDSFATCQKMFQRALDVDNNYQDAYFAAGVNLFRKYSKDGNESDLAGAMTFFDNAAQRGYDVIGQINAIVAAKQNAKPPKSDELGRLLEDVDFVFTIINAHKFSFAPYSGEFTDPFESPLRELVAPVVTTKGANETVVPPEKEPQKPPLALGLQKEIAEKTQNSLNEMIKAIKAGADKEAIGFYRELDNSLWYLDNFRWTDPNFKKTMQDINAAVKIAPYKADYESIRGKMYISDATNIINSMKNHQVNREFAEVEKEYKELLDLLVKMRSHRDELGRPVYETPALELERYGWRIRTECLAVQEFEALPISVSGIIFRDRDSIAILNDEQFTARNYADYAVESALKERTKKDGAVRRLYITDIAREEVYFSYEVKFPDLPEVKVNVFKMLEPIGQ